MARRRRHTRRNSRRHRVRRNRGRRVLRNMFGADIGRDVLMPVIAGTVGFMLDRYAGNLASQKISQLADPRYGKLAAAALGIPLIFAAAKASPMVGRNAGALVLGMGLSSAEAFLRNTPLLGGAPAAAQIASASAPAPTATSGFGSYYQDGMLSGLGRGYDVSHAGAPYTGMLGVGEYVDQPMSGVGEYVDQPMSGMGTLFAAAGLGDDPGNQAAVDATMNHMEGQPTAVATITPTDLAVRAGSMPAVRRVKTPFTAADKGYAGGMFARHLFSGMLGS